MISHAPTPRLVRLLESIGFTDLDASTFPDYYGSRDFELDDPTISSLAKETKKLAEYARETDELLCRAMVIITYAIAREMPVTEEVAAVVNAIVCRDEITPDDEVE